MKPSSRRLKDGEIYDASMVISSVWNWQGSSAIEDGRAAAVMLAVEGILKCYCVRHELAPVADRLMQIDLKTSMEFCAMAEAFTKVSVEDGPAAYRYAQVLTLVAYSRPALRDALPSALARALNAVHEEECPCCYPRLLRNVLNPILTFSAAGLLSLDVAESLVHDHVFARVHNYDTLMCAVRIVCDAMASWASELYHSEIGSQFLERFVDQARLSIGSQGDKFKAPCTCRAFSCVERLSSTRWQATGAQLPPDDEEKAAGDKEAEGNGAEVGSKDEKEEEENSDEEREQETKKDEEEEEEEEAFEEEHPGQRLQDLAAEAQRRLDSVVEIRFRKRKSKEAHVNAAIKREAETFAKFQLLPPLDSQQLTAELLQYLHQASILDQKMAVHEICFRVKTLLHAKADPNGCLEQGYSLCGQHVELYGYRALHLLAWHMPAYDREVGAAAAEMLLEARANVDGHASTNNLIGPTPLMLALISDNVMVARVLLRGGGKSPQSSCGRIPALSKGMSHAISTFSKFPTQIMEIYESKDLKGKDETMDSLVRHSLSIEPFILDAISSRKQLPEWRLLPNPIYTGATSEDREVWRGYHRWAGYISFAAAVAEMTVTRMAKKASAHYSGRVLDWDDLEARSMELRPTTLQAKDSFVAMTTPSASDVIECIRPEPVFEPECLSCLEPLSSCSKAFVVDSCGHLAYCDRCRYDALKRQVMAKSMNPGKIKNRVLSEKVATTIEITCPVCRAQGRLVDREHFQGRIYEP